MGHQLNFFPNLDIDLWTYLYAKLPPQKLMSCRLHKLPGEQIHQLALDLALFSLRDAEAIECQIKMLQQWNAKGELLHRRFTQRLGDFKNYLVASMKSVDSNPQHRLIALMTLGAMDNCSLSISQEIFDQLLNQLNAAEKDVCKLAMTELTVIIDRLSEAQFTIYLDQMIAKLDSPDEWTRRSALGFLMIIAESIKDERQFDDLINAILNTLDALSYFVRMSALVTLNGIVDRIKDGVQFSAIIDQVIDKLEDTAVLVRGKTINLLITIADKIKDKVQLLELIALVKDKLKDSNWFVRKKAVEFMKVIADKVEDEPCFTMIINDIISKLDDSSDRVHVEVWEFLTKTVDRLDETQTSLLIAKAIEKLDDHTLWVRNQVQEFLAVILSRIDDEAQFTELVNQVSIKQGGPDWINLSQSPTILSAISKKLIGPNFINLIIHISDKLDDRNSDISAKALKFLTIISDRIINEDQLAVLIRVATQKLNDSNQFVRGKTVDFLTAIVGRVKDNSRFNMLINQIIEKLDDSCEWVQGKVLDLLATVSGRLNEEQLTSLINKVPGKLIAENKFVCMKAIHFLAAIADRLGEENDFPMVTAQIIMTLSHKDRFVGLEALQFLTTNAHRIEDGMQLLELSTKIHEYLRNDDPELRHAAANLVSRLVVLGKYIIPLGDNQHPSSVEGYYLKNLTQIYSQIFGASFNYKINPTPSSSIAQM